MKHIIVLLLLFASAVFAEEQHLLYVAVPGVRDLVEYGGEGVLVFDIENGHKFVKRISTPIRVKDKAQAVKGICAHAGTRRLIFSTPTRLIGIDLVTEKVLWEKSPEGGCDRMSISPDGKYVYVPSFEGPHWNVIDPATGGTIAKIVTNSGAHNTVYGSNGSRVYMAGLRSEQLSVADTTGHTLAKTVGPFSKAIRPFTIDSAQKYAFCCVNELLGFEVGDIEAGKMIHRVEVAGFKKGNVKRHGCPSHGIGLTPDEKEVWVVDAANNAVHIFDATIMPPKQLTSITGLRDQPGWVTFSIDGRFAYPSSGEVVDAKTKKIVTTLQDESNRNVGSEKLLEIDFSGGVPIRSGNQFGVGYKF